MAGSLSHFSLNEAIGAYLVANVLVILLGASGLIDKVMKWIPAANSYGDDRWGDDPVCNGNDHICNRFTIVSRFRYFRIFTFITIPEKGSTCFICFNRSCAAGRCYACLSYQKCSGGVYPPRYVVMPTFSLNAIISIGIPLALLIICTENAHGSGVLMAQGYKPPNSAMAVFGSIVGLVASLFGAHAINIAGPMTADPFFQ